MPSTMQFQRATRKKSRLRLAVAGPAGSGKTTAALQIATGLGGRIAVIDTENESASLYSDAFDFDTLNLAMPYTPERYIEAIHAAEVAGYDIIVIDSVTHEWMGSGGCNEANELLAQTRYRGNTWSAWSETKPRHRLFLDAIVQSRAHVICSCRSKTETVQGDDKKVRKIGMKLEQDSTFEFEMTVVLELDHQTHFAVATKDRTRLFKDPVQVTADVGVMLRNWLDSGEDVPPTPAEVLHKLRDHWSMQFSKALNPTGDMGKTEEEHEAAVAASVFAVHQEVHALGEEEYRAIWQMIPAGARKAIKDYIEKAKASKEAA